MTVPESTDAAPLRAEFPVLERMAYLNAGTDGPVPRRAAEAAAARTGEELWRGRSGKSHFAGLLELTGTLRARLASLIGCDAGELALTRSTTDGVNTVLSGLDLRPGDEVLTSDEEHPGVLAPLAAAVRRRGIRVRVVPFPEIAGEVGAHTKLVACSHVSWVSGRVVEAAGLVGSGAHVLLDGAQALGAVPIDVQELGCDFYAASGQKWLCGPDGSGCLYVRRERLDELTPPWPGYMSLEDPARALELPLRGDAARLDMGVVPGPALAWSLASLDVLEGAGWEWVLERGPDLADRLAAALGERGLEVAPRGRSTLVSWASEDPAGEVERLAAGGIVVRSIPKPALMRASVGAWSSEQEIGRLAALAR